LRDQQKAESKLNFLKGCLLSHNCPQGVQFNVPLKIKEPSDQMFTKWATILTDCSRQLTDALLDFLTTKVKKCVTLMVNTVLSGMNVIILDHIARVEDINGRCDKVISHIME